MLGSTDMLVSGLALAMAMNMAAMKADAQQLARKELNNCFVEEHNKAVSEKKDSAAFNEQLASACTEKRKVYFDLVVKAERGFGSKQADAEEYANDEIQSIVDSIVGAFGENATSGAQLQKEK
jgi:hypothetical protein